MGSIPVLDGQFGRHQFCADMLQFIDLDAIDVDSRAFPE
jgi:hypothetical protein